MSRFTRIDLLWEGYVELTAQSKMFIDYNCQELKGHLMKGNSDFPIKIEMD